MWINFLSFRALLSFLLYISLVESQCVTTTVRPRSGPGTDPPPLDSFMQFVNELPEPATGEKCVNVTIEEGRYNLSTGFEITGVNLRIEGNGRVVIVFTNGRNNDDDSNEALEIGDANYVEIIGIDFDGSSGLIDFSDINIVIIQNTRFRLFQRGALNIHNCGNISILDTRFINNGEMQAMMSNNRRRFQGGAGGLSIEFTNETDFTQQPNFHIRNATFIRNQALSNLAPSASFSEFNDDGIYIGRGGAIFLIMQNKMPVEGIIENCQFIRNSADLYGGAVYIAFNSLSQNRIVIRRNLFRGNSAVLAGGAIMISYQEGGDEEHVNGVEISSSWFRSNSAEYGGAVYFFISITSGREDGELGCFVSFDSCLFILNSAKTYAATIGATSLNLFESKGETKPAEITNCNFTDNEVEFGTIIGITNFPFTFNGHNIISNNFGPGLIVVGARVTFNGQIDFDNNNIRLLSTGALLLLSNGQIELKRNTSLTFLSNKGGQGAGIVPTVAFSPSSFSKLRYNPLCSFLYEDLYTPPDQWQVKMTFNGNRAIIGSSVYTNNLNLCSWTGQPNNTFDLSKAYRWDFITFGNNNMNRVSIRNQPSHIFDVVTQPVSVTASKMVEGFPGQMISIDISSFDELNRLTYAVWRIQAIEEFSRVIQFAPSAIAANRDLNRQTEFTFLVNFDLFPPEVNLNEDEIYERPIVVTATTLLNEEESNTNFSLVIKRCPPGSILNPVAANMNYRSCQCNTEKDIIEICANTTVYLSLNVWATESKFQKDRLYTHVCPSGYCQCTVAEFSVDFMDCLNAYERDNPDSLCSCDRRGVLCGECINGTGVSVLLNKCTTCSNANIIILLLLIAWIFGWYILLLVTMEPLPTWFIPSLFYLQILPLLTLYFPLTFDKFHPYLYYFVSFLSFYFPYDFCIYSNMSTLVSYTLKFIPSLIAIVVIPCVMFIRDYVLKSKLKRVPLHGIFDIYLTIFTPTMYAIFSVFNCVRIPISRNNTEVIELRWFHDGSVVCFENGHLGLFFLALFVLLIITVGHIPGVILFFNKLLCDRTFHYVTLSLHHPYKDKFWYWGMIELVKRLAVLICIISSPLNTTYVTVMIAFIFGVHAIFLPYKSILANITDLVLGILVFLLLLNTRVEGFLLMFQDFVDSVIDKCNTDLGVTSLGIILGLLYNLPMVFVISIAVGYYGKITYDWIKQRIAKKKKLKKEVAKEIELSNLQRVFSFQRDVAGERGRANTTDIQIIRSASDVAISPTKLEATVEIEWSPITYPRKRSLTNAV